MTVTPHELPTVTPTPTPTPTPSLAAVTFLELEITGKCQLDCGHCYAESGPTGSHGSMTTGDWERLLTQAPAAGIITVQFIGGEPLRHPDFEHLLRHALAQGLRVQVFSNLYHVPEKLWGLLADPAVSLATSYYSDDPAEHDRVTGRAGSHARTLANISETIRRGIPLRVGIIDLGDGQRVEQARDQLAALGIAQIRIDRMRGVGRGVRTVPPNVRELCGRCGDGRAAVSSSGDVWMCVLSRFLPPAGNVKATPLFEILAGPAWRDLLVRVPRRDITACNPDSDGNDCAPAETVSGSATFGPLIPETRTTSDSVLMPASVLAGDCIPPNGDSNDCAPATN
jgi:MoaA/NifB/PqqE/SkfB family radical SAM enzyme